MHVLFYLRDSKTPGYGTVYCRITASGKRLVDTSTHLKLPAADWDDARRRVRPRSPLAKPANLRLDAIQTAAASYQVTCDLSHRALSPEALTEIVLRGKIQTRTFLEVYDGFVDHARSGGYAAGSIELYQYRRKKYQAYLEAKKLTNIRCEDITREVATQFHAWLRARHSATYAAKVMQVLKTVLTWAEAHGHAATNPLVSYRVRVAYRKPLVYLEAHERDKLHAAKMPTDRLKKVADCYLFSCYTGLAYAEARAIAAHHLTDIGGATYIRIHRKKSQKDKTPSVAFVPLLDEAARIWREYGGILPVCSNQQYNQQLKLVAHYAGIAKHLTTHTARKSFAHMMLNERDYSLEAVAAMLGHGDTTQLRPYVRVREELVIRQHNKLKT